MIADLARHAGIVDGIPTFPTTAIRDAMFPGAQPGDCCYVNDGSTGEGLYTFAGTAWRSVSWNTSWGEINKATATTGTAGITTDADVLTLTFTSPGGRRYRLLAHVLTLQVTTSATEFMKITDNTPTQLQVCQRSVAAASVETLFAFVEVTPAAGPVTYRARISTNGGTITLQGGGSQPHQLSADDIGPSGAPT